MLPPPRLSLPIFANKRLPMMVHLQLILGSKLQVSKKNLADSGWKLESSSGSQM